VINERIAERMQYRSGRGRAAKGAAVAAWKIPAGCHRAGMKVAVAGASGFVGSALVRRLEMGGHKVVRLVRRPAERPDEVAWHPSSSEVEQWERLEGVEAFVNLAGSNLAAGRWTAERKEEIKRSRIEGTRTLVAVMAHMNHHPRTFICASAVGYYGNRGDEELTEASRQGEGFLPISATPGRRRRGSPSPSASGPPCCAADSCWGPAAACSRSCCRCFARDWAGSSATGGSG